MSINSPIEGDGDKKISCPIRSIHIKFSQLISKILGKERRSFVSKSQKELRVDQERKFYTKWVHFHHKQYAPERNIPLSYEEVHEIALSAPDFNLFSQIVEDIWQNESDQEILFRLYLSLISPFFRSIEMFVQESDVSEFSEHKIVENATFPIINGTAYLLTQIITILGNEGIEYLERFLKNKSFEEMMIAYGSGNNGTNNYLHYGFFDSKIDSDQLSRDIEKSVQHAIMTREVLVFLENQSHDSQAIGKRTEVMNEEERGRILADIFQRKEVQEGINSIVTSGYSDISEENRMIIEEKLQFQIGEHFKGRVATGCPFFRVRYGSENQFKVLLKDFIVKVSTFLESPEGKHLIAAMK